MRTCRECKSEHDSDKLKKSLGEFSPAYSTGFCSAQCYTNYRMRAMNPGATLKGVN